MGGAGGPRRKHKYWFEVSANWKQIGKLWISPVDVADRDPVKDAEQLAKKAKEAVEEFLRGTASGVASCPVPKHHNRRF